MINNEMKKEILNDFYSIRGNFEVDKIRELADKLHKFKEDEKAEALREGKEDFDIVFDGDLQIREISSVLTVWRLEAGAVGNSHNTYGMCQLVASSILKRLEDEENWEYYDVIMASLLFGYTDVYERSYEQSYILAERCLKRIEEFSDGKAYTNIKVSVHIDMLQRLIRAKLDDIFKPSAKTLEKMQKMFKTHYDALLEICNVDIDKYSILLEVAKFRNGVFFADNDVFDKIPTKDSFAEKTTDSMELLRILQEEVEEYQYLSRKQANLPKDRKGNFLIVNNL